MSKVRDVTDKIEAMTRVISGFANLLIKNDSFKNDGLSTDDLPLDRGDESVVHEAVFLLAEQVQDKLVELLDAMEVPS